MRGTRVDDPHGSCKSERRAPQQTRYPSLGRVSSAIRIRFAGCGTSTARIVVSHEKQPDGLTRAFSESLKSRSAASGDGNAIALQDGYLTVVNSIVTVSGAGAVARFDGTYSGAYNHRFVRDGAAIGLRWGVPRPTLEAWRKATQQASRSVDSDDIRKPARQDLATGSRSRS